MRSLKIQTSITNRESACLNKYLHDISQIGMITIAEEVELAQRIKKGDQSALEKLVRANLRFVVSVAKHYQNQGLSLPDLINEGNLGLIKSAEKFDETRGLKFISYAVWWIRQSILVAIAEQATVVRLPMNQVGSLNKIKKTINVFKQKNQRNPSTKEIAGLLDLTPDEVIKIKMGSKKPTSYDAPFDDDTDNCLLDMLVNNDSPNPDSSLIKESLAKEIKRVLSTLSEKESEIIKLSFGIGCDPISNAEIGKRFGMCQEWIRKKKLSAIRSLQRSSQIKRLKAYLG